MGLRCYLLEMNACNRKRKEGRLARRKWTSMPAWQSLHQPSRCAGPKLPLCIICNGPTFLLGLCSKCGLPREGVMLSKMALCILGRSWRMWCWRWAVDAMPIAGHKPFLRRRSVIASPSWPETFEQYHLQFEKFENCKSWPSGPGWMDPKHYYHNN